MPALASIVTNIPRSMGQHGTLLGLDSSCHSDGHKPAQRAKRDTDHSLTIVDMSDPRLSLMDKWRLHYQHRAPSDRKSKYGFRALFQFHINTQLYMSLVYLVPHTFSEWDPMSIYYIKVLLCYVFIMVEANWLCTICYSSDLPDMRDRPDIDFDEWYRNPPEFFGQNGHRKTVINTIDKHGLEWKYCKFCQRYKPPRTHHCKICQTCIIRRDHHCYLVGKCIGHYNQRYFIMFCFLGVLGAVGGLFLTIPYITNMSESGVWTDYVFPWSLIKLCLGQVSWQFCLLTFHIEILIVFTVMGILYGTGQFNLVCMGLTLYELAKRVDIKVTSSYGENLRMVFGDYWGLNFLFPAQILFKQRHNGIDYDNIRIGNNKISME